MLVVTPKPQPSESLIGYVIRLTEANGYDTPGRILCYAGYASSSDLNFSCDLSLLAGIVGHDAEDWVKVSYRRSLSGKCGPVYLGEHQISEGRPFRVVTPKRTSVCPQCVLDKGYLDRFWDLTLATCCPIHACKAVRNCPSCKKSVSWLRPGLLTCRCGASLGDRAYPCADKDELEMVRLLKAKFDEPSLNRYENKVGFPIEDLAKLSFDHCATLLFILGQHIQGLSSQEALTAPDVVATVAARALRHWPRGFHNALRKLGARGEFGQDVRRGLRDTYGALYRNLSKQKKAGFDTSFIIREFDQFLSREFAKELLREISLSQTNALWLAHSMSLDSICSRFAISRKQLGSWCGHNDVEHERMTPEQLLHFVTETQIVAYIKVASERRIMQRKAAALVELPVAVLKGLVQLGLVRTQNESGRAASFSRSEIEALSLRLARVGGAVDASFPSAANLVSLARILEISRFWSKLGKAQLVVDILDGKVLPVGRSGPTLRQLYFDKTVIHEYIDERRAELTGGRCTFSFAAKVLQCSHAAVGELVSLGHLRSVDGPNLRRLERVQVQAFSDAYVTLGAIAQEIGTIPRVLHRQAHADDHDMISVVCKRGIETIFVPREGAMRFRDRIETQRHEKERRRAQLRQKLSPSQKLEKYFMQLRARETPLPRTGRRPTLRTIANDAGIDRSEFYKDEEVRTIMTAFEAEDAQTYGIDSRPDFDILRSRLQEIMERGEVDELTEWAALGKLGLSKRLSIRRDVFYKTEDALRILKKFRKGAAARAKRASTMRSGKAPSCEAVGGHRDE